MSLVSKSANTPSVARMVSLTSIQMKIRIALVSGLLSIAGANALVAAEGAAPAARKIDFNREIRPILSETCFQCHGPDAAKREADLRLDLADAAKAERNGQFAIVPGKPELSQAVARMNSTDPDERMPPPDS